MKKVLLSGLCLFAFAVSAGPGSGMSFTNVKPAKNVILMISDGTSLPVVTLTRWVYGGGPLAVDDLFCGYVRTYWAGGPISDSAPAATAMATGWKSWDKYIGMMPPRNLLPGIPPIPAGRSNAPAATILEAARLKGLATGLVATSELMHATPAAFASHALNRNNYSDIAEQMVFNSVDVVLGGGSKFLKSSERKDAEDLGADLRTAGYSYITNTAELRLWAGAEKQEKKIWALTAPASLPAEVDRDPALQPSLAELTGLALSSLSRKTDGFFLMVEGSQVDWHAHADDTVGLVREFKAFDDAVAAAVAFAKKNGETVVIVTADHGNSGISIGRKETSYADAPLSEFVDVIRKAKGSAWKFKGLFTQARTNLRPLMKEYYGITNLTGSEMTNLQNAKDDQVFGLVNSIVALRANIGYTTWGHTGEDVMLGVYSPGRDRPEGLIQNTDITRYMEQVLGLDLEAATGSLYRDAFPAFLAKGADVRSDLSQPADPVLVARKGKNTLRLPVNKNVAYLDDRMIMLDGVTVFNGDRWFVCSQALGLLP